MKKHLIFVLLIALLGGCASLPMDKPGPKGEAAVTAAPATTVPTAPAAPVATAAPAETAVPARATSAPAHMARATATPKRISTAQPTAIPEGPATAWTTTPPTPKPTKTPTPKPTKTPRPTATPKPTEAPDQTYTGTYFKFTVPGSWLKAKTADGVYFYPDANDTRHTYFMYQETENDMGLTETKLDIALVFSSKDSITAMVEGALTGSGMTNFKLSPVTIQKTKLNGLTCYKGASDITQAGETYDFVGHIFLRGDKMVLFIWVGDQVKYAAGLKKVYDSIEAVK